MLKISFVGRNTKLSNKVKDFINLKLEKHEEFLAKATTIQVIVHKYRNNTTKDRQFKIEINVSMPHAFIKVEERGSDPESITNLIEPVLKRRLKRYSDNLRKFDKKIPWKIAQYEEDLGKFEDSDEVPTQSYIDYIPNIKVHQYENDRPMHVAEAIERMELLGHNSYLFKNIDTKKYSMLYRRNNGYGLVEPKS